MYSKFKRSQFAEENGRNELDPFKMNLFLWFTWEKEHTKL